MKKNEDIKISFKRKKGEIIVSIKVTPAESDLKLIVKKMKNLRRNRYV